MERAASQVRDGENVGFEIIEKHVTPELAYILEIERAKAKVGGREDIAPSALRETLMTVKASCRDPVVATGRPIARCT